MNFLFRCCVIERHVPEDIAKSEEREGQGKGGGEAAISLESFRFSGTAKKREKSPQKKRKEYGAMRWSRHCH